MRCGHCHKDHETVAEVRACSGVDTVIQSSDPQRSTLPHQKPSKGSPFRQAWEKIPEGYYAIDGRDGRQTDFYRVDQPDEGKWKGWTFLNMVIGGKPAQAIKNWDRGWEVLELIAANPSAASIRYGLEIGRCGKCNRHLTDQISRERGIGPDCWAKYYGGMAA